MAKLTFCELCDANNDRTNPQVGGHIVCPSCKKKLKIWKTDTILKYKKKCEENNPFPEPYKDVLLNHRKGILKKLIFIDIILEKLKSMK